MPKQFKKIYIPADALKKRQDFECWYEDGILFCEVKSQNKDNPWQNEKDKISLISRHGAQMGQIKPDYKALTYAMRMERWTYTLHTYTIFEHYYIEGMLWQVEKSPLEAPFTFYNEGYDKKDVRLRIVEFADKGTCYEVAVKDVSKLRAAVISVIGIMIKEEFRGLSEGEPDEYKAWHAKLKNFFLEKGHTFDELVEAGAISNSVLEKLEH